MTKRERDNWEKLKSKFAQDDRGEINQSELEELYKALLKFPDRGSKMQGKKIWEELFGHEV